MPQIGKTLIMKFGGAAVSSPECFPRIADLIIRRSHDYKRIVIVISAMRGMTDQLIGLAHKVHPIPPRREYDMLVSVGERISISLLAMALSLKGKEAVSLTGSQSGIITSNQHTEASIIDVRPARLNNYLVQEKFVIVAGFQGVSLEKEITTLGRGGSDTSAVALGVALQAEKVEFYKDVSGVCNDDPKKYPDSLPHQSLTYDMAMRIIEKTGGKLLHLRAISLARQNGIPLHVRSFISDNDKGTYISSLGNKPTEPLYECIPRYTDPI